MSWKRNVKAGVGKSVKWINNNLKLAHKKVELEKDCENRPKGYGNLNVQLGK